VRLVSYNENLPGLLIDGRVVALSPLLDDFAELDWDRRMPALIGSFERLRPAIDKLAAGAGGILLPEARLDSPIPRPRKLLCELGDYNESIPEPKGATDFYLKSPDSVTGPGAAIAIPRVGAEPFRARGAIATVIGRPARNVAAGDAWGYVFGFVPFIDIGTEAFGRPNIGTFFGNSFDGFGPMGPCVVTADEIADPLSLRIRFSVNGQTIQDYGVSELHFTIPEQLEAASAIMTLRPGDVVVSGKFLHGGPALKAGDALAVEIAGLGELRVGVNG